MTLATAAPQQQSAREDLLAAVSSAITAWEAAHPGLLARLRERGYWAERAHASKGTFDIVAVYPVETLLIRLN
ncbi:MAG: hypothetical protein WC145_12585 [Aliarcobacter sp.]